MKHHRYLVPLVLGVTLAACQSSGAPAARAATLNQEIQLAPTEQAAYAQQGLTVEFVKVVEDSRCPSDATCVWAGEVKVQVATRIDEAEAVQHEIKAGEHAAVGAFRVMVVSVQPERLSTREIQPEEYRVTLRVEETMPSDPKATEVWSPVPSRVTPGATAGAPPSDAIVLFDGKNLEAWKSVQGGDAKWRVEHGELVIAPGTGDIQTRQNFGDVQLHVEWRAPKLPPDKVNQDRGNSGVFLQDVYEVQILDNFENETYVNGMVGSIYKQYPPLVNATVPAETWQTYDIIFTAPRFAADGSVVSPARMTVLHNGVLVQNNASLEGATTYIGAPSYRAHGEMPLRLQDHSHEVRFRNIWLRRL